MTRYFAATRHPWACLLFVLPLLLLYEAGVIYLGGTDPNALRNGADAWLRWGLDRYGLGQVWVAPALVVAVLLVRSWANWPTRPWEPLATGFGMVLESLLFAVGLWALARNFEPLMSRFGVPVASVSFRTPAAEQVVTYVGAGIYEEVLFRLGLFSAACFLLRVVSVPTLPAVLLAGVGAALTFAAAHHIGPGGEEMVPARFLFRTLAGLYFTALYVVRGFGVAVGAHAGYDVLVGVAVG
ncbi:MAG TPA: CPBP family intramembrane glutamic endopeptidase [Fimbriiglobus sp.]|nr:CPBP family intramembrane glutamic endopeptidase [Fimbriiglobus sp.]